MNLSRLIAVLGGDAGYGMLECWMLDAGCWMLDAGCWMLDAGCWMLAGRIMAQDVALLWIQGRYFKEST